jgi:hypothetical protein
MSTFWHRARKSMAMGGADGGLIASHLFNSMRHLCRPVGGRRHAARAFGVCGVAAHLSKLISFKCGFGIPEKDNSSRLYSL